ncbi:MAG TPA: hypothetical protein DEB31_00595 [Clostridiales bacterium]|nr:hypothetical protein [Clostridiales bacterium]
MSNAVWFISYKLLEGASVPDYLVASQKVHDEILSKQKGFISWRVLKDGDTWVDMVTWETPEDAKNAETAGQSNPIAQAYYSLMDFNNMQNQMYMVEKSY